MKQRGPNRRDISQIKMARNEWETYRKKDKTYHCTSCSRAILTEDIITAHSFRIIDGTSEVKYLVGYRIACKDECIKPYYDSKVIHTCKCGDDECPECCQTCIFAQPYIVQIQSGVPKGKKAARWANPPKIGVIVTRIIYRCTNLMRMEQFNEGTFMCAYIRCDQYKKRKEK